MFLVTKWAMRHSSAVALCLPIVVLLLSFIRIGAEPRTSYTVQTRIYSTLTSTLSIDDRLWLTTAFELDDGTLDFAKLRTIWNAQSTFWGDWQDRVGNYIDILREQPVNMVRSPENIVILMNLGMAVLVLAAAQEAESLYTL